ncbi:PREDICTED: uncharacterized protein LOC108559620 [Nicrophorus vespilloides]|uniref:Uncharacterized protein LOC108559620 n=1 Tax=Nicrophorus vespilloides TaxID=110193 RepID=A0ABM1MCZ4_NICVS|nr:PREDICTED: uncharacterized protein LOC108559620 [Nicrophorus vespilloides]
MEETVGTKQVRFNLLMMSTSINVFRVVKVIKERTKEREYCNIVEQNKMKYFYDPYLYANFVRYTTDNEETRAWWNDRYHAENNCWNCLHRIAEDMRDIFLRIKYIFMSEGHKRAFMALYYKEPFWHLVKTLKESMEIANNHKDTLKMNMTHYELLQKMREQDYVINDFYDKILDVQKYFQILSKLIRPIMEDFEQKRADLQTHIDLTL